jgi:hypothetical protein
LSRWGRPEYDESGELGGEVMAKPEALAVLRDTVEGFLRKSFDDVHVDRFGDFHVRPGGVTTWIQVRSLDEEQTAVLVWSPSNIGMAVDAELTRFLATEANDLSFGQFELHDGRPARVHVSHALLGEFLSREELEVAVEAVAAASARYGPIVKERFGGRLASEHEIRPGQPVAVLEEIKEAVERTGRWPPPAAAAEPPRSRVRRALVVVVPSLLAVGVLVFAYQWLGS